MQLQLAVVCSRDGEVCLDILVQSALHLVHVYLVLTAVLSWIDAAIAFPRSSDYLIFGQSFDPDTREVGQSNAVTMCVERGLD